MYVGSRLVRSGCLFTVLVLSGGTRAIAAPGDPCHRGEPETVLMGEVRLPDADTSDRVLQQALDLLEPLIHRRPPAATVRASDYPDLPLAGLAGFRVCVVGTGAIDPETYINRETSMYRLAAAHSLAGLVAVAATVVHELEHGRHASEADAYGAETAFVRHWVRTQPATGPDRGILEQFLATLETTTTRLRRSAHGSPDPR